MMIGNDDVGGDDRVETVIKEYIFLITQYNGTILMKFLYLLKSTKFYFYR